MRSLARSGTVGSLAVASLGIAVTVARLALADAAAPG
jgi:hypothetical protein